MESRVKELSQLHRYVEIADKGVTMILQNLQWDRKRLLEEPLMTVCNYDRHHKLPQENLKTHEEQCFLKSQSYMKEDLLLPDPLDINANTVVKLSTQDIMKIIKDASIQDPLFKKGNIRRFTEPLNLERLQFTYTADERRAIHDAVVSAVPSCHDLTDLALPSRGCDKGVKHREKSRNEILAELRDMKRRRPKYRVAAKTRNYSDVLRDVIKTQMEFYSDAIRSEDTVSIISKESYYQGKNVAIQGETENNQNDYNAASKFWKSTDYETLASKNIRRIEHSKRNSVDRRIRSDYYESNRKERERETKYKYTNRMESSSRNDKEREDGCYKSNSYRRNREVRSHDRDKSKRVQTTRSDYKEQKEQGGKRNSDRESYTSDESTSVESSENDSSGRDSYSKHRRRYGNRDYYYRNSEKRRKHNECYYSLRNETGRRSKNIKKERLDTTDREHWSRSTRSDYYDSFNRNAYSPIMVKKLEPEDGERASRDEYNASSYSGTNQTKTIRIKVEKGQSTDSESTDSDNSSSYYSSSSNTGTEGQTPRNERGKTLNIERRKARGKYLNNSNYRDAQLANINGHEHLAIKTETFEREPRHKETRNVYYSSYTQASNRANLQIKLEQPDFEDRQGRDGHATDSNYTNVYTNKNGESGEVREKHNYTFYYGDHSGSSGIRESNRYYSSYGEVKRCEKDNRSRGNDVYTSYKGYARHYTNDREHDVHGKRTHSRQS